MATTQSFIVPTSLYNNFDDTEMIVEFNDKGMFLQPFGLELLTHEDVAYPDLFRKCILALANGSIFTESVKKYLPTLDSTDGYVRMQAFIGYLFGLVHKFNRMSINDPCLVQQQQSMLAQYEQISNHLYVRLHDRTERLDGGYDTGTAILTYRDVVIEVTRRSYDNGIIDYTTVIKAPSMCFYPLFDIFNQAKRYTSMLPIYVALEGQDLSEYIRKNGKDHKPMVDLITNAIHAVVDDTCDTSSIQEEVQRMFDMIGLKDPGICTEIMSPSSYGDRVEMMYLFRSVC